MRIWLAVLVLTMAGSATADDAIARDDRAVPSRQSQLLARAKADLAMAAAIRGLAERKPQPKNVEWSASKTGGLELGATTVAATVIDWNRDGRDEILLLTTEELVVIDLRATVVERVTIPPSVTRSRLRDAVGGIVATMSGGQPIVELRTSEQQVGTRFEQRKDGAPSRVAFEGYPMCSGVSAELVPRRNVYSGKSVRGALPGTAQLAADFMSLQCARPWYRPDGHSSVGFGVVDDTGLLTVSITGKCLRPLDCPAGPLEWSMANVGSAFAIADIDSDGRADVVTTSDVAPGGSDQVLVTTRHDDTTKVVFHHDFDAGVVAVVIGDFDGVGALDVVALVREWRQPEVELWRLN